jgi:hypothetical protein
VFSALNINRIPYNPAQVVLPFSRYMTDLESRSREISYMKYVNGRRTGLVTFYVEIAFYNGLLKERYKGG